MWALTTEWIAHEPKTRYSIRTGWKLTSLGFQYNLLVSTIYYLRPSSWHCLSHFHFFPFSPLVINNTPAWCVRKRVFVVEANSNFSGCNYDKLLLPSSAYQLPFIADYCITSWPGLIKLGDILLCANVVFHDQGARIGGNRCWINSLSEPCVFYLGKWASDFSPRDSDSQKLHADVTCPYLRNYPTVTCMERNNLWSAFSCTWLSRNAQWTRICCRPSIATAVAPAVNVSCHDMKGAACNFLSPCHISRKVGSLKIPGTIHRELWRVEGEFHVTQSEIRGYSYWNESLVYWRLVWIVKHEGKEGINREEGMNNPEPCVLCLSKQ